MTPAEKLARYLDDEGETVHAAIVRRLAAALVDSYNCVPTHIQLQLSLYHADALRDVRDIPVEVQA